MRHDAARARGGDILHQLFESVDIGKLLKILPIFSE